MGARSAGEDHRAGTALLRSTTFVGARSAGDQGPTSAELADQTTDAFLGVAKQHAGIFLVEQRVLDAGKA